MVRVLARRTCLMFAISASLLSANAQSPAPSPRMMIPDEATAIRIAEAIFMSRYGAKTMEGNRPYKAHLSDSVWLVWGTIPEGAFGVGLYAQIDQKAGCILRLGPD